MTDFNKLFEITSDSRVELGEEMKKTLNTELCIGSISS